MEARIRKATTRAWNDLAGFTLLEMVIVVAIVGLLMSLAIPAYQEFMRKSRRAEAKEVIYEAAQRLQQYYTQNDAYTTNATTLQMSTSSTNGYYTMTIAAGNTGSITTSYLITAAPAGTQTADTDCGSFMLNSLGQRTVSGSQTTPPCW
jgi:type IV pilus assembly protein PilE